MKLSPGSPLQMLFDTLPQQGKVVWIGVRPERYAPLESVREVEAIEERGLSGDHHVKSRGGKRQVTLIQKEHLSAIASIMKMETVAPELLRRNLVVEGLNLLALKDKFFLIGNVLLEYTGECHPCTRMEENLGPGGYNAMRGHGGITARVLRGGFITISNVVRCLPASDIG